MKRYRTPQALGTSIPPQPARLKSKQRHTPLTHTPNALHTHNQCIALPHSIQRCIVPSLRITHPPASPFIAKRRSNGNAHQKTVVLTHGTRRFEGGM